MSDIWSNVSGNIGPQGSDWLYQMDGQVRGPISKDAIVTKLMAGEISLETKVAREGSDDFHPVVQVAAFSEDMGKVKRALGKAESRKARKVWLITILVVALAGSGFGYYFKLETEKKKAENARHIAAAEEKRKAEEREMHELLNQKSELVALVSLGDIQSMEVGGKKKVRPKKSGKPGAKEAEPAQMVSQCSRGTQEIYSVLGKNLAKINICVEDEKKRNANLPGTLTLSFVAVPDGSVSEFEIEDRHFRTGPMRNCMLKAFRTIRFPKADGSNCPVTIPIKIGG